METQPLCLFDFTVSVLTSLGPPVIYVDVVMQRLQKKETKKQERQNKKK